MTLYCTAYSGHLQHAQLSSGHQASGAVDSKPIVLRVVERGWVKMANRNKKAGKRLAVIIEADSMMCAREKQPVYLMFVAQI